MHRSDSHEKNLNGRKISSAAGVVSRLQLDLAVVGWLLVIVAFVTAWSPPSHAAGVHDDEHERWVFSAALEMGLFGHTGKGNVSGTPVGSPRVTPLAFNFGDQRDINVVPDDRSREPILSALFGGTFEVMTPQLANVLTRPRLFLDVNISAVVTNEVGLARSADPGQLGFPPTALEDGGTSGVFVGENTVLGRGTKITVQHQSPQVHAGLGAAFTFGFGSERIRIKPSIVYSRIITDIFAVTKRAVRLTSFQPNVPRFFADEFRTIELSDKMREVYHGVGPALEIEYETGNRIGPFTVTLFLKGHASRLFGDLKTQLEQTNQDPIATVNETVRWKYTQDRWVFRASTGMRFRLVPKRRR